MHDTAPAAASLTRARLEFSRGQLDLASESCREVLELLPGQAGALHLLGVIAHQREDPIEAAELLRRAADAADTTALYLLTYVELCCQSDPQRAVELTRRAVSLDQASPLGWCYLGSLLMKGQQFEESHCCFERALALDERFWQAHVHLSILMRDEGRYVDALAQAELAISAQPDDLAHSLRAAEIELLLGRHSAAWARLEGVEARESPDARGTANAPWVALKAQLLRLMDRYDEAVTLCRDALARGTESADVLRAYGLALHLAGDEGAALAMFDRAAVGTPAPALSDKGVLLAQLGRLTEACQSFDAALRHEPAFADAWYNKSNAKSFTAEDPELRAMQDVLETGGSYRNRLLLHFALGKAHADAGDVTQAFWHWNQGNGMKRATVDYDAEATGRHLARLADPPQNGHAAPAVDANHSELPVLIVGMPRCGSSLLEQILASHPEVHGAGELVRLRNVFAQDRPSADLAVERLGRFSPTARRIIDKDLGNFMHLGIAHNLLPRARFIHCRRDPLDTCFSAFTKLFAGDYPFSYDLRELGLYYRGYARLMAHWRAMLPPAVFMEVDYETLVCEPQREIRRLLDFLGLPWSDACMNFFETSRAVNTASFAQVRRPLYRSSVGRAQGFRVHLEPLIQALG